MQTTTSEVTLREAINRCVKEGTPVRLQELSELIREKRRLRDNKHSLYKMMLKQLKMQGGRVNPVS
jgi:hypothetical protein